MNIKIFQGIFDYVSNIIDINIKEDKEIIMWGNGKCGSYFKHWVEAVDKRKKIQYIIDESAPNNCYEVFVNYRKSLLQYIDTKKFILCSCVPDIGVIIDEVKQYGFKIGDNMFDIHESLGYGYFDYLQKNNPELNFTTVLKQNMDITGEENMQYAACSYAAVDKIFSEIVGLEEEISFWDYGCGKGAAMIMAYMYGVNKIGGVELSEKIYKQAVKNMDVLGIPCEIIHGDATSILHDIDNYNCFFFYNPFVGTVFKKVIENIEDSYKRNNRRIYLIYGNPFCHKSVVENGLFRLYK